MIILKRILLNSASCVWLYQNRKAFYNDKKCDKKHVLTKLVARTRFSDFDYLFS